MKAFFISTVIFLAMTAVIIFNYIYINNAADQLLEITENIAPGASDMRSKVTELEDFWNRNKDKMEFTTNHTSINSIGIKIANIRLFTDSNDFFQLQKEILLLKEEIREMRRLEKFSIGNIF